MFQNYRENHFLKYVNRPNRTEPYISLLNAGHKSRISLLLTEWAKKKKYNSLQFASTPSSQTRGTQCIHVFQPWFATMLPHNSHAATREDPG
jgi:hypothetical protein